MNSDVKMQFRDTSDYIGVTFSIKFLWYYHFWCQCWVFSTMELGHLFFLNLLFNSPNRMALCVRGKISLTCPCLDADNGSQCAITPQMLPAICWMCLQLWHTDCSCRCALRQISWLPTAHPCDLAWIHQHVVRKMHIWAIEKKHEKHWAPQRSL